MFWLRRIPDLATLLSLLIALFIVSLWIDCDANDGRAGQELPLLHGKHFTNWLACEGGIISLRIWGQGKAPVPFPVPDEWVAARTRAYHCIKIARCGIAWGDVVCYGPAQGEGNQLVRGIKFYDDVILHVVMPHWAAVILFLALPFLRLIVCVKRLRRKCANLCSRCGYDLRATPVRCPECGLAINASDASFASAMPATAHTNQVPSSTCSK